MNAAKYIFEHYARCRREGLSAAAWSALLFMSTRPETWFTRLEIMRSLTWRRDNGTTGLDAIAQPLLDRGFLEREIVTGKGGATYRYRVTLAGVAFLKLPKGRTEGTETTEGGNTHDEHGRHQRAA